MTAGKKRQEEEFRPANGGVLRELDMGQKIVTYMCRLLAEVRTEEDWKSYFEVVVLLERAANNLFETAAAGILPHRDAARLRKKFADEMEKDLERQSRPERTALKNAGRMV